MEYSGNRWIIHGEPHLLLRLKRIFPRTDQREHGQLTFFDTPDTCEELLWVMQRWPLEIAADDLEYLNSRRQQHVDTLLRLEQLVDVDYKPKPAALAEPARDYQLVGAEVWRAKGGIIIGDDVGLGKTVTAIAGFVHEALRPAVVVCQAGTMPVQWERMINRFAPSLLVHVVESTKVYPLPQFMGRAPDVVILTYHKLQAWSDVLAGYAKSVVFDEVQELRRTESNKYAAARHLCRAIQFRAGLTATPVYNYGDEIHSIVSCLMPDALGSREEFLREWCFGADSRRVSQPKALGSYLRENFIMLRRTRHEVGRELPPVETIVYPIDADHEALDAVQGRAAELANIILRQAEARGGHVNPLELGEASRELDRLMRQATGIAKAPFVAAFIRMLIEAGERPVVYAWHREVYSILMEQLEDLEPVMFTGSETAEKKQANKDAFCNGHAGCLLVSLRSGAGLDGLQYASRCVVFAELDWSPGIHHQCIGRVDRDGQPDKVVAYFCVSEVGSDPIVSETIGVKKEQAEGIRNPDSDGIENMQIDPGRLKKLAQSVLDKRGNHPPASA